MRYMPRQRKSGAPSAISDTITRFSHFIGFIMKSDPKVYMCRLLIALPWIPHDPIEYDFQSHIAWQIPIKYRSLRHQNRWPRVSKSWTIFKLYLHLPKTNKLCRFSQPSVDDFTVSSKSFFYLFSQTVSGTRVTSFRAHVTYLANWRILPCGAIYGATKSHRVRGKVVPQLVRNHML